MVVEKNVVFGVAVVRSGAVWCGCGLFRMYGKDDISKMNLIENQKKLNL